MTRLIPVGEGLGVQIPPHLLKAAHLDDASDLFFEVTMQGLLIKPPVMTKKQAIDHLKQFRKEHGRFTDEELKAMKEEGRL